MGSRSDTLPCPLGERRRRARVRCRHLDIRREFRATHLDGLGQRHDRSHRRRRQVRHADVVAVLRPDLCEQASEVGRGLDALVGLLVEEAKDQLFHVGADARLVS